MVQRYFTEKENTEWLANLPKKSIAAKAIIKSNKGNILLVKPNYKDTWQLPGGGIEAGEEPLDGLIRELGEELNLSIDKGKFRLLDTVFRHDHDELILIFECSIPLKEDEPVQYQEEELDGYKFEPLQSVGPLLSDYYASFWQGYFTE